MQKKRVVGCRVKNIIKFRMKGGNMDKYTKFILTMIAVALFGINYHLFSGDIISEANAAHKRASLVTHVYIDNWPN